MAENNLRILVVDDSISIVNGLVKILTLSGFEVEPAYNGHDALRKLSILVYDLVICDIEMPGMNGLDLLKHVRRDFDNIPFILMTGYLEQDNFFKAIQYGASDFIRKPIDTDQLLNTIQIQLNKRKDDSDYLQVSSYMSYADLRLSLPPNMFRQVDFIKIFTKFFKHNLNLNNTLINELLLCLEEMLYNAFIHGTLKLNLKERTLSYEEYKKLIHSKLLQPEISEKRIHLRLCIDQEQQVMIIEVEDEGQGFDYAKWLERIQTNEGIQLDEYGRGVSIIYHLADKVTFGKGGRLIRIEKNLLNALREPLQASV
jgi:YesN/AraC family two-component response regulator